MKYSIPILLIHGGAGNWRERDSENAKKEIDNALRVGYEEFKSGNSLDAVVSAISYMEDSGLFDAGIGSVKNSKGEIEMDAGLMLGNDLRAGAVASVKVKNPIRLAKRVLEDGRHVLMVGRNDDFPFFAHSGNYGGDTVGAVALDKDGNLVAGTSTGGISGKLPGRVGDSPIPGAGYYATQRVAVSSTGVGEIILKILPAKEVDILVSMGFSLEDVVRSVINKVTNIFGKGNIGMIAIDNKGVATAYYNTLGMARGIKWSDGQKTMIFEGEI
ncbi:isoaspartyl peptidase/L-asparaginase [Acidianus sp. RZ1]|uniref:isoaspartyl peptidase/L-asparaginase n=1 Tax=Acidianus sp. RZ1 TaxID=1540082 RepID=UPI001490A573|nr:arginase [Acidianus sp. RZ1]